jgi:uncharacterized protein (TIGR03437 family)
LGDGGPATSALLETPQAVAVDAGGNLFIADSGNRVIRKVSRGVISTLPGYTGYAYDLKLDSAGNLYIAAYYYVYKLTQAGVLTTVAGNGNTDNTGDGGPATAAAFRGIYSIALDSANNLYIADYGNHRIRKVTAADGIVRTVAGTGAKGFGGDGAAATGALLNYPEYVAVDGAGNIYINDSNNYRIRMVGTDGNINTIAGSGTTCCNSPDGGLATSAYLNLGPMAADRTGNVYFWDYVTSRVRMVSGGILSPFAGTGKDGFAGDGTGAAGARFSGVSGIATDSANNVYIVEANNERVRVITGGIINTVAGKAHFGGDTGPAATALLHRPQGVAIAADGTVYFTDTVNHRIRKIALDGTISTIAGTGDPGFSGDGQPAASAMLAYPDRITVDSSGNLFFVDQSDVRVRKIAPSGTIATVAGNGNCCYSNESGNALNSAFYIGGIAVDGSGNLYVSDYYNSKIKKVTPSGGLSTYAGTGVYGYGGDGQQALRAQMRDPSDLAVDRVGNLYINDTYNYRIRKVDTLGVITTIAGNGNCCANGDGGQATAAAIDPTAMAADSAGGLWFVDYIGVRYVARDGTIARVAGGSALGYGGDDAPSGPASLFYYPRGIALAAAGDLIVADTTNSRIRKLQPNDPVKMDIVSGNSQAGVTGTALKALIVKVTGRAAFPVPAMKVTFQVTAGTATLSAPSTVTDAAGQAGIAVTPTKAGALTLTATAGSLTATFTATVTDPVAPPPACSPQPVIASVNSLGDFGGATTFAPGSWLEIKGTNLAASTRQWGGGDFTGAIAPTSLDGVSVTINGNKAFVGYISPTQINVQAPGDTATGDVQLTVTAGSCTSGTTTVTEATIAPGLLAPSSFKVSGTQYLVALFPNGVFVGNENLISGAAFRPAAPGDTITAYGIGFGSVIPSSSPGLVASGLTSVPNLTISFGITAAKILYGGLVPGIIGEYQFTFVVPAVPDGDYPIVFQVGSTIAAQTVYLTVHK